MCMNDCTCKKGHMVTTVCCFRWPHAISHWKGVLLKTITKSACHCNNNVFFAKKWIESVENFERTRNCRVPRALCSWQLVVRQMQAAKQVPFESRWLCIMLQLWYACEQFSTALQTMYKPVYWLSSPIIIDLASKPGNSSSLTHVVNASNLSTFHLHQQGGIDRTLRNTARSAAARVIQATTDANGISFGWFRKTCSTN